MEKMRFYLKLLKVIPRLLIIAIRLLRKKRISLKRLTRSNIKGFTQGHLREYEADSLEVHIKEQVLWRIVIMRQTCLEKGECPCECEVPGKQFEDRACEEGCYLPLLSKEDWENYKTISNIKMLEIKLIALDLLERYNIELPFNVLRA